jgi:hypothetical protein
MDLFDLPLGLDISEELINKCEERKDYSEIFFECYKFVAINFLYPYSCLTYPQSWINSDINTESWWVLIGFLAYIQKIVASQLALISGNWWHKEAIMILSRWITETSLHGQWIIKNFSNQSVQKFIAMSLKKDLELEVIIEENREVEWRKKDYPVEERLRKQREARMNETSVNTEEIIRSLASKYPKIKDLFFDAYPKEKAQTGYAFPYAFQCHIAHGDWIGIRYWGFLSKKNNIYIPSDSWEPDNVLFMQSITEIFAYLKPFSSFVLNENLDEYFDNILSEIIHFYYRDNELKDITIR